MQLSTRAQGLQRLGKDGDTLQTVFKAWGMPSNEKVTVFTKATYLKGPSCWPWTMLTFLNIQWYASVPKEQPDTMIRNSSVPVDSLPMEGQVPFNCLEDKLKYAIHLLELLQSTNQKYW